MKTYEIFKKRDGQDWKPVNEIYAKNRWDAKKQFANLMTRDNHNLSNNIQWLTKEQDGVFETGFYDFNAGSPIYNEETESYDPTEAKDFLLITQKDILKGFDFWSEDVYQWKLAETSHEN